VLLVLVLLVLVLVLLLLLLLLPPPRVAPQPGQGKVDQYIVPLAGHAGREGVLLHRGQRRYVYSSGEVHDSQIMDYPP